MTETQKKNYNNMLATLKRIVVYQSPNRLRRDSNKDWGLEFEEAIEMAYENIQEEARVSSKGLRFIK